MKKTVLAVLVAVAATAAPIAVAHADTGGAPDYAAGQMIVKFRPGVAATASLRAQGARIERRLPVRGTVVVDLPNGRDVLQAVAAMKRDPRVEYAQPDYYMHALALPNDALFGQQWALRNTGQTAHDTAGKAGADIHAPEAWDRTTGSPNVKVAVIDSGLTWGQPDLAPNLWRNPGETGGGRESNGVDDDGNGYVDDWRGWDFVQQDNDPADNHGHGTAVAGTIAARGNNGIGVAGVAWQASLIPIRVLDNFNTGKCSEIAAGMAYAAKTGARIAQVSIGAPFICQPEHDAIDAAPNVLFVIGSGNDGLPVADYPCAYESPNILCVGATDQNDAPADYSNFNAQSVDLAAPGTNILSAWPKPGKSEVFFTDGFETPLAGRWLPGAQNTWDRTSTGARTGGWALTDSPQGNYADGSESYVYLMQPLDLRGKRGCFANVWVHQKLNPNPPNWPGGDDYLVAEASVDGFHWGRRVHALQGVTPGYQLWQVDLSELEGRNNPPLSFRFGLWSDSTANFDGVYLDDFEVVCGSPIETYSGAADEFDYDTGTSYSGPLVSGVAALLLSLDPSLSTADLKQRIMSSVDPLPALAGKTVTGGRLNAAKAVATIPLTPGRAATPSASPQAAGLQLIAKKLRIRALLRGVATVRVHAPSAGRLSVVLKSGKRTVAMGRRSVKRPGAYSLRVRPTRRGRSLLRHSKHLGVTVVLTLKPRSGSALAQSTTLALRR